MPLPSALDQEAPADVIRLSHTGRRTRLVVAAVALVLMLAGTLWGQDDAFPFGPFKMYSGRADPNASVVSTRVVGVTAAGEEVRLSGGQVGLRRAEFEGQLPRIEAHPELLGLLAESYAARHPDAEPLVDVRVVARHFLLSGGQQTGAYDDEVVVEFDLAEEGP